MSLNILKAIYQTKPDARFQIPFAGKEQEFHKIIKLKHIFYFILDREDHNPIEG